MKHRASFPPPMGWTSLAMINDGRKGEGREGKVKGVLSSGVF